MASFVRGTTLAQNATPQTAAALGVMSTDMFLHLKNEPQLETCRDGGSIFASYTDFWGDNFLFTLPVKWSGTTKEDVHVSGYNAPFLEKYIKIKKISKGSGKPYFETFYIGYK